jgi:signal transduction histidine kinase
MLRLLQNVFASMSLERKCLLFFGSALLLLMFGAFWVLQVLASKLVLHQTRQIAWDHGQNYLKLRHVEEVYKDHLQRWQPGAIHEADVLLESLVPVLDNDNSVVEVLSPAEESRFDHLPATSAELGEGDLAAMQMLRGGFEQWLQSVAGSQPLLDPDDESNEFPALAEPTVNSQPLHTHRGPVGDRYYFYRPVVFNDQCMRCHSRIGESFKLAEADPETITAEYPFRVLRISMPFEPTNEANTQIRALLIAIAMMIIAVGLFVLHAIVRYLVLQPLYHLRDVSDAISRGETELRAHIDTEDEFRELADAFNRMLRHLIETQDKISEVNRELDQRVDQLAQLNLQLYEANRLKSDFLANMSHELRTPLNSIIGFSDVLQGIESLSEKQRRYASNIQRSGRMLLEMINDILDLAKVEAGKMEVRRSTFNLLSVIHSQIDMVRGLSDDKNLSLTVQCETELPMAEQDQGKIGQILTNLLSNAIKFTPEGGMITVTVEDLTEREPGGESRFRISVADTGIGIAEEDQRVIFEKFRQSRTVLDGDGLTREFSGTGLGLSIVKELCKLLGGEIHFESELGQGSTFRVILPWRLPESSTAGRLEPSAMLTENLSG